MQILVAKFTSNNVTPSCRLNSMGLLCLWQCFSFKFLSSNRKTLSVACAPVDPLASVVGAPQLAQLL